MPKMNEAQIIRTYNMVELGENEEIENGYYDDKSIELTIRDKKNGTIRSVTSNLEYDLKSLNFIVYGMDLTRDEK